MRPFNSAQSIDDIAVSVSVLGDIERDSRIKIVVAWNGYLGCPLGKG